MCSHYTLCLVDDCSYWPAQSQLDPNTYQRAAESIALTSSQGGHPRNNLNSIFGKADRVADYQRRWR